MGTVIKVGEQNPRLLRRLETVNVSDHLAEARLVLEASRREAVEVLAHAAQEAAAVQSDAAQRGYEEGFRRGYQAGAKAGQERAFAEAKERFAAEQVDLVRALSSVVDRYEAVQQDLALAARQEVLQFAARVAERVTLQVGAVRTEAATANLEAALKLVQGATQLRVRLNPADRAAVDKFAETIRERMDDAVHVRIEADAGIAPGGCVLCTPESEVDATLETQIARIAALVTGKDAESA